MYGVPNSLSPASCSMPLCAPRRCLPTPILSRDIIRRKNSTPCCRRCRSPQRLSGEREIAFSLSPALMISIRLLPTPSLFSWTALGMSPISRHRARSLIFFLLLVRESNDFLIQSSRFTDEVQLGKIGQERKKAVPP